MFRNLMKKKLLLLITSILFVIFTLTGILTWLNDTKMITSMSHQQADLIINNIDNNINSIKLEDDLTKISKLIKGITGDNYVDEVSIHEKQNGIIIASTNQKRVNEKGSSKIKDVIKNNKTMNSESKEDGIHVMNMMAPIHNEGNNVIGAVHIKINLTAIDKMATLMMLRVIGIVLAGFIITVIIIYQTVNKPLIYLSDKALLISNGNLKNRDINIKYVGEMGLLAKTFKIMTEQLHSTLTVIQQSIIKVEEVTNHISTSMEQSNQASREVSSSIENMALSTSEVAENVDHIATSANNTNEYVEDVLNSSDKVTELSYQTTEISMNGIKAMNDLSNLTDDVMKESQKVGNKINNLKNHAQQIYEVLHVIKKISNQTNLLALNAEIEASHAGEAGKGFSVVANEIRNLSIETGHNSTQIEDIINGITNEIDEVVHTEKGLMEYRVQERELTNNTQNIFHKITDSINQLVSEINNSKQKTSNVIERINAISISVNTISDKTQENNGINEEIVASVQELNANVEMVNENTKHLKELVKNLEEVSKQFSL